MVTIDSAGHTCAVSHEVCDGQTKELMGEDITARMPSIPGWELADGCLQRTFRFASFSQSLGFVTQMAMIAEKINHHPDFCVNSKRAVTVTLWTHQMNCLTGLDFDLAEAISAVAPTLPGSEAS